MPEPMRCPACMRAVRAGTRFCPDCGRGLDEAPAELTAVFAAGAGPAAAAAAVQSAGKARFAEQWSELKSVLWLFGLLLLSSLLLGFASRSDHTPWPSVVASAADALIIVVAAALRLPKLRFLFRLHPLGAAAWLQLAGVSAVAIVLLAAYFWLLERAGMPIIPVSAAYVAAGWPLWALFLFTSVAPAVFEEIGFRGVIQSTLERVLNSRDAWLIQAALFSVSHLSPLIFPSHFVMGLCFGWLRRRSRSIYPGMLMHALWNALVLLQELSG